MKLIVKRINIHPVASLDWQYHSDEKNCVKTINWKLLWTIVKSKNKKCQVMNSRFWNNQKCHLTDRATVAESRLMAIKKVTHWFYFCCYVTYKWIFFPSFFAKILAYLMIFLFKSRGHVLWFSKNHQNNGQGQKMLLLYLATIYYIATDILHISF